MQQRFCMQLRCWVLCRFLSEVQLCWVWWNFWPSAFGHFYLKVAAELFLLFFLFTLCEFCQRTAKGFMSSSFSKRVNIIQRLLCGNTELVAKNNSAWMFDASLQLQGILLQSFQLLCTRAFCSTILRLYVCEYECVCLCGTYRLCFKDHTMEFV